jgi:hypothetical protein
VKHEDEATLPFRVHQVQITFTHKQLTAWGGVCSLVAKFLEQIAFREWVAQHVPIKEKSPNAKGVYGKVLALLLTALTGGSRFSHVTWWAHGLESLRACFGVTWLPQSASVLTRFLAKFTRKQSEALRTACAAQALTLLTAEKITHDHLMLDSTVCTRYGRQEGARKGYNPKKPGRPSHHPLKALLGRGYVVNLWNRSGNTASAEQALSFYDQTCRTLAGHVQLDWVLGDSGFADDTMLTHLEQQPQRYIMAVRLTPYVLAGIQAIGVWQQLEDGLQVGEMTLALSTWHHPRRFVVVRQHIKKRPDAPGKQPLLFADMEEYREWRYSVMVTSDTALAAADVWRTYRPRANIENGIKELKHDYGWDAFNVHSFWGTEAVMLLIGMVCYNLVHYLNRCVLKTADTALARLKTLRPRLLAIPALYGSGGRRPTLRLGIQDQSLRGKFRYWLEQISRLGVRLVNCNAVGAGSATNAPFQEVTVPA